LEFGSAEFTSTAAGADHVAESELVEIRVRAGQRETAE